jgi:hypothetical protein
MVPQSFRRFGLRSARVVGLGAGILALTSVSCQSLPLLAPSGSTLTLIPAANELAVNGTISITATVIEGAASTGTGTTTPTTSVGQPVNNGTQVTFTTTLGTIQPATANTKNGQVTVQLVGDGRSGVAKITAFSGAASANTTINIGAAAAARLVLTANPQSLPATGGSSTIAASVQDASGVGLAGVSVSFSTTAGTLAAGSVVTDANGNATTTLSTALAATVTATAAGTTGSGTTTTSGLSQTVAIAVNPRTAVTVTGPSTALTVSAPATLTIALASSSTTGSPVVTAMHIDYGDWRGNDLSPGTTSTVVFYSNEGVYTVTVTVTDSTGAQSSGSATLAIGALSASATTVPTSITHGTSATFVVTPSNTAAFIDHYEWNFGDGSAVQSTSSGTNSHVYATAGTYNIVVNVVPQFGATISVPIAIIVS